MAKSTKNTSSKSTTPAKRGPGRPPSMPGEKMVNRPFRVAEDIPGLIQRHATLTGAKSMGAFLTTLVRKEAARLESLADAKVARRLAKATETAA